MDSIEALMGDDFQHILEVMKAHLGSIERQVSLIREEDLRDIREQMKSKVSHDRFVPVERAVYGLIATILLIVIVALCATVIVKGK